MQYAIRGDDRLSSDFEYLVKRFDAMCGDFTKLREFVEEIAASQIRIEAVFVTQTEMLEKYNGLDVRLTRIETYFYLIGATLTIVGGALGTIIAKLWLV